MRQVDLAAAAAEPLLSPFSWVKFLCDYGLRGGDWRLFSWHPTFHSVEMYENDRRSSALRHSALLGPSQFILSMAFACLKSARLYGRSSTSPHVRVFVPLLAVLKHDTNPEAEFLDEI